MTTVVQTPTVPSPTAASGTVQPSAASEQPTGKPRRPQRSVARRLGLVVGIGAVLTVTLVPLLYLVLLAFMPNTEVLSGNIVPERLTLDNWPAFWERMPMLLYFRNSVIAAVGGTLLSLVIATMVAYAIVRFRTGGGVLPVFVLSSFVAPPVVAIIPLFFLLRSIGLLNQPVGIALVYGLVNVSVATWLLTSFVERVPQELEEAAQIDGASRMSILVRIVLPLLAPGLVATGIVLLILNFNELILALTMAQSEQSQTLPVAISLFQGDRGVQFGQMAAASLTAMLPVYVCAIFMQKWLVGGLTNGAVK